MPKEILDKIMQVIGADVPTEAYLQAENIATFLEEDRGALTDLRTMRDRVVHGARELAVDIARLAVDIDRLRRETATINGMDSAVKDLLKPAPVERFPASDEQTNTL